MPANDWVDAWINDHDDMYHIHDQQSGRTFVAIMHRYTNDTPDIIPTPILRPIIHTATTPTTRNTDNPRMNPDTLTTSLTHHGYTDEADRWINEHILPTHYPAPTPYNTQLTHTEYLNPHHFE